MKNLLPLIVAVVLGAFAVIGVQHYIGQKDLEYRQKVMPKSVIVSAAKIAAGEKLAPDLLRQKEFPAAMLPENVVTPDMLKDVLNKPVNRDVYPGEPILWSFLGVQKAANSLSQVIKPDERAVTISVDNVGGIDGYIQPNDRVDIYILTDVPVKKKQEVLNKEGGVTTIEVEGKQQASFLLLQNVIVLATGSSFGSGVVPTQQAYTTITLSVTPEEAGLLKFATGVGQLSLTLRNPQDFGEASKIEVFNMDSILDVAKLRDVQAERKKRIEVYKQGKSEIVER